MSQPPQQPPIVMQNDQTRGTDAQKTNFMAVEAVTDILKTSFGSMGMDKMLVDSLGESLITNDGATILNELDIDHPAARILIEASSTTDVRVGDGTTSTALLAGAILQASKELVFKDVHPNIIVKALKKISKQLIIELNNIAIDIDPKDSDFIKKVITTSLASKVASVDSNKLKGIVFEAIQNVTNEDGVVDVSAIKIEKRGGGNIGDSELIKGIIIDKSVSHPGMPRKIKDAKVALINAVLEIQRPENEGQVNINSSNLNAIVEEEAKILKSVADKIIQTGANIVICERGIDDLVSHYLQKAGIMAIKRVREQDMVNLQKATGANIVNTIDAFSSEDLGYVENIEEKIMDDSASIYMEGCQNPNAVTILLHGSAPKIVDELERSLHDALMVTKDVIELPKVVIGAGAPEISLSRKIEKWGAGELIGREKLVSRCVSRALIELPLILAKNAGMDSIMTELEIGNVSEDGFGINLDTLNVSTPVDVYEPLAVKIQVINSAIETACIILRIDNMLKSNKVPMPQ